MKTRERTSTGDGFFKGFWYDGWFHAKFIHPLTVDLDKIVIQFIRDDASVIDIGCGTGELARDLATKHRSVVGVDISSKMIEYANIHNAQPNADYILIRKGDEIPEVVEGKFDYGILKLIIHEIPEVERARLVSEAKQICAEIIIVDFIAPQPLSYVGQRTFVLEFFAGTNHFRNFKHWHDHGGLDGFLERQRLVVQQAEMSKDRTKKVVRVTW